VYYLAPNGSDSAAGTMAAPFGTILGASRHLAPGDTLWVRGGTYHDPGGHDWARTASGTAAAPITVAAYPGESPVFDGGASAPASGPDSHAQQALILDGVSYLSFEGLAFTRYDPYDNGMFLVVNADHIHFIGIRGYGEFTAQDTEHFFYISHSSDVDIAGCHLDGIAGAAVHIYSSDYVPGSGAVSSRNVTVAGSVFTNMGHWGILAGSGLAGGAFIGNTITSRQVGVEFDSPTSDVWMNRNVIMAPTGILTNLSAYGGYGPATETADCIESEVPFRIGWPGEPWTLGQWQATGRGAWTTVGSCGL
jgi:hypothetical protein